MPSSDPTNQQDSQYPIEAENVAEMARLSKQARLLNEHLGLVPSPLSLSQFPSMLDLGCGPGDWVVQVAQSSPASHVVGVDLSKLMIAYAQYCAHTQSLSNTYFLPMDARQPLSFSDASFHLIHARLITLFLSTITWPQLLQECFRLLHPGGVLCNTEIDSIGITTSPAITRTSALYTQALRQAGQCFISEGPSFGIVAVQARLFAQAGFQNIRQQAAVLNFSRGMPAHQPWCENFRAALKLIQPFLVSSGVTTQEELDLLYQRALDEMEREDFCAVVFFQTTWGDKPMLS